MPKDMLSLVPTNNAIAPLTHIPITAPVQKELDKQTGVMGGILEKTTVGIRAAVAIDNVAMQETTALAQGMMDIYNRQTDAQMKTFVEQYIRQELPQMVREIDAIRATGIGAIQGVVSQTLTPPKKGWFK